jgi:uncharacterized protein (DUF362 family)
MDRREFLKHSLAAAGGLALGGVWPRLARAEEPTSRVSLVRNPALAEADDDTANALLRSMTLAAIADAVGAADAGAAMRKLFKPDDIVGLKLNCIAPQMAPCPAVAYAVVEALGYAGVPRTNVIIFDKEDRDLTAAGYTCTATGDGPLVFGTVGESRNPGYEERFTEEGDTSFCLSKIVTRECTALINIPVIKQHSFAGMTCALKNHFGCIHNPEDFHYKDGCNPAVADVNKTPAIRTKQRLCVCDAFNVQYEGGPAYNARYVEFYGGVLASTDPVALDAEAMLIVDAFREKNSLKPLKDLERPPKHIATAARYGLGCDDPQRIQLVVRNA